MSGSGEGGREGGTDGERGGKMGGMGKGGGGRVVSQVGVLLSVSFTLTSCPPQPPTKQPTMCDCVKANNPCCPRCETVVCGALPSANGCTTHSFAPARPGCSGLGGPVCAVAAPVTCFNGCCGINPLNKHCVGAVNGHSTCAATCTTRNSKGPCYCRSTWGAYPTQPATCGKCVCLNGCGPRAAIFPGSACPNSCNSAFACPDLPWEAARRLFPNINGSWALTLLDWVSHNECDEVGRALLFSARLSL